MGKIKIILIIVVVAIIILLAVAGGYYLFQKYSKEGDTEAERVQGLGSQIFDAVKGPIERIPEINPFKRVKLNPFE